MSERPASPTPTVARHVSPHVFRHSIAWHLKSAGYAAEFIQKFLGHQSIKTTMDTYGTLSLGEMQQIIAQRQATIGQECHGSDNEP
jgi:integrase